MHIAIVMQFELGKHWQLCRSRCQHFWKLRYISSQAFILLQQWMGRRLSILGKQSVNTLRMIYLLSCEFSYGKNLLFDSICCCKRASHICHQTLQQLPFVNCPIAIEKSSTKTSSQIRDKEILNSVGPFLIIFTWIA